MKDFYEKAYTELLKKNNELHDRHIVLGGQVEELTQAVKAISKSDCPCSVVARHTLEEINEPR